MVHPAAFLYASSTRDGGRFQKVLVEGLDGPSIDAFGRWRISDPQTIFDSKLLAGDKQPLFWDESLESGAGISSSAPTAGKPYTDFTSTLNTAGVFTRQTFRRFNYQPGKGQLYQLTGVLKLSGGGSGVKRRLGAFDDNNGAFFEDDNEVVGVVVRSNDTGSPLDTRIVQSKWNIDTMDGSGDENNPSGILADFTKGQVFVIDYQWLSLGGIRFGIEINRRTRYIHQVEPANVETIPWASTPNLPVRYQMVTTASSPVSVMRANCASVASEGETDDIGLVRYASTEGAAVVTDAENSLFAVIGLRLKSTHFGATIKMLAAQIQIQTAAEFIEWVLLFNPTVADTFSYSDITNSAVQRALGATANTVTGGTQLAGGYLETGGGNSGGASVAGALTNALILGASIANVPDEIVLAVRPIGGVSAVAVEGSLGWRELF